MSDFTPIGPADMVRSEAGGEFFRHSERDDGTRDLFFGPTDGSGDHGHAVISPLGNLQFLRESDGHTVADDSSD